MIEASLVERRLTVSVAESMTGGFIASQFTIKPGASRFFLGGIVAYSNEAKVSLLGVDPKVIQTLGAVSEPVALMMAEGALHAFHSDLALSITGIAGPSGGSAEKPVGTAYCAIAQKGKKSRSFYFVAKSKDRMAIIEEATGFLLQQLEEIITS